MRHHIENITGSRQESSSLYLSRFQFIPRKMPDININLEEKFNEATAAYKRGNCSRAEQIFQDLSESNLDDHDRGRCKLNYACCKASSGKYKEALEILQSQDLVSIGAEFLYDKALCEYRLANYDDASDTLEKLFERSREEYPRLHDGLPIDLEDENLVDELELSCLIEAMNLKSAILYKYGNDSDGARACLDTLPLRDVSDYDCVSLHNLSIYNCTTDPHSSVDILTHLIKIGREEAQENNLDSIPKEAATNAAILFTALGKVDLARDLVNDERFVASEIFDTHIHELLKYELNQDDIETKLRYLDKMLDRIIKELDERSSANSGQTLTDLALVVASLEGSIMWERSQSSSLERLIAKTDELLKESHLWQTNIAHFNFLQDTRFDQCCLLYEALLPQSTSESLLRVDPIVIANLCVSYVLTGRNIDAEELIKEVESDESLSASSTQPVDLELPVTWQADSSSSSAHMSIINIVVGTLYCVKHNFDFGLSRIFKGLEPMSRNLNYRTWYHAKRCILYLMECYCRQWVTVSDETFDQVVSFLKKCEQKGLSEAANRPIVGQRVGNVESVERVRSVSYESRYLRSILLPIIHD